MILIVKVLIEKCNSYKEKDVLPAIKAAFKLWKPKKHKIVLIKPNLLGSYRKRHVVTTNPKIIEAICKVLKENKNKIWIGDSSFENTEKAIKKSGIIKIAKKYNAKVINFDRAKQKLIKIPKNKYLKKFYLPEPILKADYIISVPKLKTHVLTKLTCAIKNNFGMLAGAKKQYYHKIAPNEEQFAELLLELQRKVNPDFTIVDAVIGMEGEGPSAGKPKRTELILASTDQIALDLVACDIIGFKRDSVLTNKLSKKPKIQIIGKKIKVSYEPPAVHQATKLFKILNRYIPKPKITCDTKICIKCRSCEKRCPVNAIKLQPYPLVNTKTCIRCFCCIEVCPVHALYLKTTFIRKILTYLRNKMVKI